MDYPYTLPCKFASSSSVISSRSHFRCPLNNTQSKSLPKRVGVLVPDGKNLGLFSVGPIRRVSAKKSISAVSSVETREGIEESQSTKPGSDKVKVKLRLDHQVSFGQHVAVLGSVKEFGSWKKEVMMKWTKNGWVCNLELESPKESVEYKFVIIGEDKKLKWENGDNRILKIPGQGNVNVVCKWDKTTEEVELLPWGKEEGHEVEAKGSENGNFVASTIDDPVTTSGFVEQWQGKNVSFHRSKDNLDMEKSIILIIRNFLLSARFIHAYRRSRQSSLHPFP